MSIVGDEVGAQSTTSTSPFESSSRGRIMKALRPWFRYCAVAGMFSVSMACGSPLELEVRAEGAFGVNVNLDGKDGETPAHVLTVDDDVPRHLADALNV